jgi:hypothetical protein
MMDLRTLRLLCVVPAAAVLVAMIGFGIERPRMTERTGPYFEAVAAGIGAIPYRIEGWIGADVPPQAPAIQLLRPNKLLQRRYLRDDQTEAMSLLFVHCADARDMQGHFPPVCYPSHGWIMAGSERVEFAMGDRRVPAMVYKLFTVRNGVEQRMTILNFFVVPSAADPLAEDMKAVNRAAAASAQSWLGAAQLQIILHREATAEEMIGLMRVVAPAIEPALRKVMDAA